MKDFLSRFMDYQEDSEYRLKWLSKLPHKAQVIALAYLDYLEDIAREQTQDYEVPKIEFECASPIETIFNIAFYIYDNEYCRETGKILKADICPFGYWIKGFLSLEPQYEINVDGRKYIADFSVELVHWELGEKGYEINKIPLKILIECDGHDFHQKTRKQIIYDNERQLALQTAGYEVVRFSGSQIYKEPLECAEKAYNFILSKISK